MNKEELEMENKGLEMENERLKMKNAKLKARVLVNQWCCSCFKSVEWGSGRFVNRVPTDDGWLCGECDQNPNIPSDGEVI